MFLIKRYINISPYNLCISKYNFLKVITTKKQAYITLYIKYKALKLIATKKHAFFKRFQKVLISQKKLLESFEYLGMASKAIHTKSRNEQ